MRKGVGCAKWEEHKNQGMRARGSCLTRDVGHYLNQSRDSVKRESK